METYIALLRGINVSGQKLIKMADLKIHLEELKFRHVRTYIQSGNILFENKTTGHKQLAEKIAQKIKEKYGFEVPVILLNFSELKNIFDNNPFLNNPKKDIEKIYATILSDEPAKEHLEKLSSFDYSPEEYIQQEKIIYFYSPNGYGNAKMNNNFFENILKVKATTRNWKTICKLVELCL